MYNKIFTKILDSSIWLESHTTRIIWLTMLASMDQDGFCQFAALGNLAQRAIVSREAAESAIKVLESPDKDSSDPDNEGRRIERVDGGWMVLNASKYRDIVTSANAREKTRERVTRFRKKQNVTPCNVSVTLSEAYAEAVSEADTKKNIRPRSASDNSGIFAKFYSSYPRHEAKGTAKKAFPKAVNRVMVEQQTSLELAADFIHQRAMTYAIYCREQNKPREFIPLPASWLNAERYMDDPSAWVADDKLPAEQKKSRLQEDFDGIERAAARVFAEDDAGDKGQVSEPEAGKRDIGSILAGLAGHSGANGSGKV